MSIDEIIAQRYVDTMKAFSTATRAAHPKGGKGWRQAFQRCLGEEAKRVAAFGTDGRGAKRNDGESQFLTLPSQWLAAEAAGGNLGVHVSSKPKSLQSSEESPMDVSSSRKPAVGETKEHVEEAHAPHRRRVTRRLCKGLRIYGRTRNSEPS